MKFLKKVMRRVLLYLASFSAIAALVLVFGYPVWTGQRVLFLFDEPDLVPIWKADLHQTFGGFLILELLWAAILALPPYLGLAELDGARNRCA
jgi:hypothetical protein